MEPIKIDEKNRALILGYANKRDAAILMMNQIITVIKNVHGVNGDCEISPDATQIIPKENKDDAPT